MDFNEYQKNVDASNRLPKDTSLFFLGLGLGEAGEVQDKIKKVIRDDGGILTEQRKQGIIMELGDLLWYMSNIATWMNISLEEIAKRNIDKVNDRANRNVVFGDGDDR